MTLCHRCNHEAVTERPPHLCALHYLEKRIYDAWASGDDREARRIIAGLAEIRDERQK